MSVLPHSDEPPISVLLGAAPDTAAPADSDTVPDSTADSVHPVHKQQLLDDLAAADRAFVRQRTARRSMILTPNIDLQSDITQEHDVQTQQTSVSTIEFTEQRITRLTLKFQLLPHESVDDTLEQKFRNDYYAKNKQPVCTMLLLACIVWALFAIVDVQKNAQGLRKMFAQTCILRACTCVYGLISCFILYDKGPYIAANRAARTGARTGRTNSRDYGTTGTQSLYMRFLLWSNGIVSSENGMQFWVGTTMLTFGISQIVFGIWQQDDLDPTFSLILILIPSCSSTMLRQRFMYSLVFTTVLLVLFTILTVATTAYKSNSDFALTVIGLFVANVLFSIHAYNREYIIRKNYLTNCQLLQEEQRSQRLLDRMLPQSIIRKLRTSDETHENFIYQHYDCVSILFSHIVNFDDHTARLTPMTVITLLNNLFSQFDQLTDTYKVYKVETIGDVYLIASGCPDEYRRTDHAAVLCVVAIEMMAIIDALKLDISTDNVNIDIRIGINSGPIIAGVVGARYPRYRLMGDSINTASRMSTTCDTGDIQLSTSTYQLLPHKYFTCTDRGQIPIKGKGLMNTYLLQSHRYDEYTDPDNTGTMRRVHTRRTYNKAFLGGDASSDTTNNVEQIKQTAAELQRTLMQDTENSTSESGMYDSAEDEACTSVAHTPRAEPLAVVPGKLTSSVHRHTPSLRNTPMFSHATMNTYVEQLQTEAAARNRRSAASAAVTPLQLHSPELPPFNHATSQTRGTPLNLCAAQDVSLRPMSVDDSGVRTPYPLRHIAALNSTSRRFNPSISNLHHNSQLGSAPSANQTNAGTVVIAAASDDIKVNRVFVLGAVEEIIRPKNRRWTQIFTQRFTNHMELENDFQAYYTHKYSANMRRWTSFVVLCLLPLAFYDTVYQLELDQTDAISIWSVRFTGLLCGLAYYILSFNAKYVKHIQLLSSIMLSIAGCVFMYICGVLGTYYKSYGVAIVLILLSLVSMFVSLQFIYACISVTALLVVWLIIAQLYGGSIPGIGLMLLAGAVAYVESGYSNEHYVREDYVRYRKQLNEKKRTKQFLENMLPGSVIASMADDSQLLVAHERPHADVFFSDIQGFTALAAKFSPEDVVAILNVMFNTFDALTHRYGIYKVETIGDAYLACNGVIEQNQPGHTRALIDFALAVQTSIRYFKSPDKQPIVVRIGIHSGYVIAGVVGKKMPRYHLFGETVTIAEEMEQKGIAGRVCISEATRMALDAHECALYELERIDPIRLPNDHMLSRYLVRPSTAHPDVQRVNKRTSRRNTPLDFTPIKRSSEIISARTRHSNMFPTLVNKANAQTDHIIHVVG